jgi:Tat protein secretion system quality control protein TatD with DNase activity
MALRRKPEGLLINALGLNFMSGMLTRTPYGSSNGARPEKLGAIIHRFYGFREIAEQYLKLGYHIGIGGSVLQYSITRPASDI